MKIRKRSIVVLLLTVFIVGGIFLGVKLNFYIFGDANLTLAEKRVEIGKIVSGEKSYYEVVTNYLTKSKIREYKSVENRGARSFYYNDNWDYNPSINFIDSVLDRNMEGFNSLFDYEDEIPVNIFFIDGETVADGYVNIDGSINLIKIENYTPNTDSESVGKMMYEGMVIHEYIHFITRQKLMKYSYDPRVVPRWFMEGLGEYGENLLTGFMGKVGKLQWVDLKKDSEADGERGDDFYEASRRVVREIYKDKGKSGIEEIISKAYSLGFDNALKEATGKSLDDYSYVFNEEY